MNKKDEFKNFVRNHPELIEFVNNNQITWQKFYEMYSLYGEKSEIWNKYIKKEEKQKEEKEKLSFSEIIDLAKRVDVDSLQKNITNINKGLALIESLIVKDNTVDNYTPRPLYKKFED